MYCCLRDGAELMRANYDVAGAPASAYPVYGMRNTDTEVKQLSRVNVLVANLCQSTECLKAYAALGNRSVPNPSSDGAHM